MRLLIADDDASLRKQLKRFFETRGHSVEVAKDGIEAWHQLRRQAPDIVLTDVVMPDMDGFELTRTIRRNPATQHIPVMLFSARSNHNGRTDFPDEVLPKPLDLDLLEARAEALVKRGAGHVPINVGGSVIAMTSAKGGAGLSSLVANLSLALAMQSKRSVVAVDLDLEYGDLPMMVDVPVGGGLDELINALANDPDSVAPEDFFARHPTGLRILASPRSPVDALRIDEASTTALLQRLRTLHDLVLVDVPPGFGDPALATLTSADRIVVLITPEVTALRRTISLLEVLAALGIEEDIVTLVLNELVESPDLSRDRVEGFLGRRIPVVIGHDLALFHRATTTGKPIVLLEPQHGISHAVNRLSRLLLAATV